MNLYFDKRGNEVGKNSNYFWKIEFDYEPNCTYLVVHKGRSSSLEGIYLYKHSKKKRIAKKDREKLQNILPEKTWETLNQKIVEEIL